MIYRYFFVALFAFAASEAGTAATLCADLRDWRDDDAGAPVHWRTGDGSAQIADAGSRVYAAALVSPAFEVPVSGLSLSWRQRRELSWANSAGVLDVAVGDGEWRDITTLGAKFDDGDYDGRSFAGNPLGARRAWGPGVTMSTTRLALPATLAHRTVRLRFRFGSGGTGDTRPGWFITNLRCELPR